LTDAGELEKLWGLDGAGREDYFFPGREGGAVGEGNAYGSLLVAVLMGFEVDFGDLGLGQDLEVGVG